MTKEYCMTSLRKAVREGALENASVFVMDCCLSHLAADVVTHAHRLEVQIVIIPARFTWLMRPLDTHVFVD